MGKKRKGKPKERRGKKEKKKKVKKPLYKLYAKKGDKLERSAKFCPKCGAGFYMAKHNNRSTCGKCKYTVFEK